MNRELQQLEMCLQWKGFARSSLMLYVQQIMHAVTLQRKSGCEPTTCCYCARANWGCVAIFSNTEKFRCLYSYYGSCMPSSPKEYIHPCFDILLATGSSELMTAQKHDSVSSQSESHRKYFVL